MEMRDPISNSYPSLTLRYAYDSVNRLTGGSELGILRVEA